MRVVKAIFEFRGWYCEWLPGRIRIDHGRRYRIWKIKIWHCGILKNTHRYLAFTPSAHICRILIRHHYKTIRRGWNKKKKGLVMKGNKFIHL